MQRLISDLAHPIHGATDGQLRSAKWVMSVMTSPSLEWL